MNKPKEDFFKINSNEMLKEDFKHLTELIKKYSNNINVFEEENFLYFNVKSIYTFGKYFKDLSNFAYYNSAIEYITEEEFKPFKSEYNLRNDLNE